MSLRSFWVTVASISVSAFACGGGVSYSGASQPRVVDAIRLGAGDSAPSGQRRLGRVTAQCSRVDARDGLDGARLSDVGCSGALLRAALRERSASTGGAFLVGEQCEPDDPSALGGSLECEAEVWGPAEGTAIAAPEPLPPNVDPWGPAAALGVAYGSVGEAWHVSVDFWPAPGQTGLTPVAVEQVSELDFPRVGTRTLGSVRARAGAGGRVETLRGALRAAAARAGATSLIGVRCIEEGDERSCIASIAAPEADEQAITRAAAAHPIAEAR